MDQIFSNYNKLFNRSKIDIVLYNIKSDNWWKNKEGILLKSYRNISGDIIKKESKIIILHKMQYLRHNSFIHIGKFFIKDNLFNEIGGVYCYDILLLDSDCG